MERVRVISERRAEENFESFEDFEEFFIYCVKTNRMRLSQKEIAFRLGYTQSSFSQRMKREDPGNLPRFNLNDVWRYMKIFKDYRPLRYLEWCEKTWKKEEFNNGNMLVTVLKDIEEMRKKIEVLAVSVKNMVEHREEKEE